MSALSFLPFLWSQYQFMCNALFAMLLLTPMLGLLGSMTVSSKLAFFSDALGHSALTGVALGVVLGIGNPLWSMVAFGIVMALLITRVKAASASSADTVIGVFSSTAIALGLVLLSRGGSVARYSSYLVGDVLAITPRDLMTLAVTLAVVVVLWVLLYNPLQLLCLNEPLARSRGVKTALIENVFVMMVAVVVMISIQWVGVLLINALLVLPAAAARNISGTARRYTALSVGFSMATGAAGLLASFYWNTSAGPTIALFGAGLFFVTYAIRRVRRT